MSESQGTGATREREFAGKTLNSTLRFPGSTIRQRTLYDIVRINVLVQFLLDCEASRANYSVHSVSILQRNLGDVKRILIVDDSALIRRTLRSLLEGHYDWSICGEAENGSDAVVKARNLHPDLVVMDHVMPIMNGIDATRTLKAVMPHVANVMYTTLVRRIQNLFGNESPPFFAQRGLRFAFVNSFRRRWFAMRLFLFVFRRIPPYAGV